MGVPGPKPNVIFGNLLEIYLKNSLWAVNDWHRKFGPVVSITCAIIDASGESSLGMVLEIETTRFAAQESSQSFCH